MKFTINRATWLRGEGNSKSYLLRESDNKMCCLGFFGQACGISRQDMEDVCIPSDIFSLWGDDQSWLVDTRYTTNLVDTEKLMTTNDDAALLDAVREQSIIEVFAKHGVEVEFIG